MTEDFKTFHLRRMFERDIASFRANQSEHGEPLYPEDLHRSLLRRLEDAIEQAGGDAAYVDSQIHALTADLAALGRQTESTDRTLGAFNLPPTLGKIAAESDTLRMIGMSDPDELPVDETNLESRAKEWAHGPHQRGYALEHKPGRDAVVGEVIETKAGWHCEGPRRQLKADLIQILWTHYLRKTPKYVPSKGSIEMFAAKITNRRIQQFVREDSKRRKAAPGELTVDPAAVQPDRAEAPDLELLRAVLDRLPDADQTVVMAVLTHKKVSAAAKSLAMKRQTFVDRVERIFSRLSSKLRP